MEMSFENFIINNELAKRIFDTCCVIFLMAIILYVGLVIFKLNKGFVNVPIILLINIPRLLISLLAFVFVFCFDYSENTIIYPHFDNMLFSTFLVGILAFIEIISSLTMIIKETVDSINSKN